MAETCEKIALTPKEAAELTPLGEQRIRGLCHNDPSFPAFKNGRDFIIPRGPFEEWLAKQAEDKVGFDPVFRRIKRKKYG